LDAFHDLQTQSPARCPEKNMPFTTPPSNKDTTASRINVSTEPTQVYVQRIQRKNEKPSLKTALTGIKILGTGASTGSKCVPNEDLAELGYDSDWILQRTGIQSRFHVAEGEATSDLAIRAVDQCLENAGVDGKDVDLIILATVSPDHVTPSTACIVQAHLGCDAPAMDINAACSGFIYGLVTASQFVRNGCARNALVIGAENVTMMMDPSDVKTFPLFGDGAGAVLITADDCEDESAASGILSYRIASDGSLRDSLQTPAGGSRHPLDQEVIDNGLQYLKMDGRAVFKWAVRLIPEAVYDVLEKASLTLDDIDLFIPHQANVRIIDAAAEELGIDREKVFINLDRYGNTSAASIPIAISEAVAQGRIKRGANVMMVGFGAGLTWGACIVRW
jgi:3-oxoacyl-[acyl-carrier-protein] synthase-3